MKTLELTKVEERALKKLLGYNKEACSSGCAFEEMQTKKKGCENCPYDKAMTSLGEKMGIYE